MEIVDKNVAMLSNFEVLDLLSNSQKKTKGKKPNGRSQNLATITYETNEYLAKTPCALQNRSAITDKSPKVMEDFMNALKPFKLTKAEKLQMVNLRPVSQVEIQLIIEEIEERLTEDEMAELLEVIETLPSAETEQTEETNSTEETGTT